MYIYIYVGYVKQIKGGWSWDNPMTAPSIHFAHTATVGQSSVYDGLDQHVPWMQLEFHACSTGEKNWQLPSGKLT